ncbi:hypothetical protein KI387_019433, partial [Taxus chinensis]
GKRWTAEQVSVEYIKHLQLRVKELTKKRKEMTEEKLSAASEAFPTVKVNCVGSNVFVSINAFKCDVVLSDVLRTLEDDGLDIVSAVSSAINDKVFLTLCAEDTDVNVFDSATLHEKMWNL